MPVYLVQHGKAVDENLDPSRPLSAEGRAQTTRIAEVAAGYAVQVSRIEHSGKLRAEQTAMIMASDLAADGAVEARPGLSPKDDVVGVAASLDADSGVMLVGHLPFMERLVGQLVAGDADRRVFKFQGGGIVCLDRDELGWHIRWSLMPEIG